jgi:hypothetical protein
MTPINDCFKDIRVGDRVAWFEEGGDPENGPSGELDEASGFVVGKNEDRVTVMVARDDGETSTLTSSVRVKLVPKEPDALPCPFCGGTIWPTFIHTASRSYMQCTHCEARGPVVNHSRRDTMDQEGVALLRWNMRGGVKPTIKMRDSE